MADFWQKIYNKFKHSRLPYSIDENGDIFDLIDRRIILGAAAILSREAVPDITQLTSIVDNIYMKSETNTLVNNIVNQAITTINQVIQQQGTDLTGQLTTETTARIAGDANL